MAPGDSHVVTGPYQTTVKYLTLQINFYVAAGDSNVGTRPFSRFGLLLDLKSCDKSLFSIPLFNQQIQHFKRPELSFIDHPEEQLFSEVDAVMCAHYLALFHCHPSIKQSLGRKELVSV